MGKTSRQSSNRTAVMVEGLEGRLLMSVTGRIGGIAVDPSDTALLLPAVQAAREAAKPTSVQDGTSNTILVAEQYAGGGYVNPSTYQIISAGK
jgi:hypothetical protein